MIEELNRLMKQAADAHNNSPLEQFDGLSPDQMGFVIYEPFDPMSPIHFREMTKADMAKIPMLNMVKSFGELLEAQGEIKLTKKGFLPIKIVRQLYNPEVMTDEMIEWEISRLYKEIDCMPVHLTRILSELIPVSKKRNNKISLIKMGRKLLSDEKLLLREVIKTFSVRFNWGYFDGYESESIGQFGFLFSLYLLHKYGDENRPAKFYSEKYLNAFPHLVDELDESAFRSKSSAFHSCYEVRTFSRYLSRLGIVELSKSDSPERETFVTTNSLFKKMVECRV